MSDLKPCPHCGEDPIEQAIEAHKHYLVNLPDYPGSHVIECVCGAGSIGETRDEAKAKWNRRAQPAQATSEIREIPAFEPAQAGQVLTDEEISSIAIQNPPDVHLYARAIEQAVLAKRVPMTEAQMLAAFAVAHPQDHADMQDGSPANAIERIGARAVYRRFERGIRAAEHHHGIVGEKGGA